MRSTAKRWPASLMTLMPSEPHLWLHLVCAAAAFFLYPPGGGWFRKHHRVHHTRRGRMIRGRLWAGAGLAPEPAATGTRT